MPTLEMETSLKMHLEALERELLDPSVRADRRRVAALLADEFLEIGAPGAVSGKDAVLQALPHEQGVRFEAGRMHVCLVTAGVARVNYAATRTLGNDVRRSLRSSWWRCDLDANWRMVFHQGTPDTGLGSF